MRARDVAFLAGALSAATLAGAARGVAQTSAVSPAPSPTATATATSDIDKQIAADLFRKALAIDDPSEAKVDLLKDAVSRDPSAPTYYTALQAATEALQQKRQSEAKQLDQQNRDRKQAEVAKAAGAQAQDRLDEAFALRRGGRLSDARQAAEKAAELARGTGSPLLVDQTSRLISVLDGEIALRRNIWRGLLVAAVLGAGLAVVLLRKRTRRLEMVEGPEPGRVFKLDKDLTTIGAVDTDADIVIPDEFRNISRRHCQVARSGRHFFLVDCSRNGTFLNGRAVSKHKPVLLRRNDEITLSDSVILIYR